MPRTPTALVSPALLVWARRSIGLSVDVAAAKAGVSEKKLESWESGDSEPTIAQLRILAKQYKRPLAVFFLDSPPQGWDVMRDFRRVPDPEAGQWSPELHGEYRRALDQRDAALDIADRTREELPTSWRLPEPISLDDEALAAAARRRLLETAPIPLPGPTADEYAQLGFWVTALEEAGVLVMTSAGVERREMRGFSLYFDVLPVIMMNGKDFPRGRLFSLLHEYAHLLLHSSGLCDQVVAQRAVSVDRKLEARCNALAAAILMPRELLLRVPQVAGVRPGHEGWTDATLRAVARPFGVSSEAALRRLLTLGMTTDGFYSARREYFVRKYEDELEQRDARNKASGSGDYYRTHARDLGKGFVRLVVAAYRQSAIDTYTAASYLDVKVRGIDKLADAAALRGEL
ncbi:ImmA/IrrE family metallo-endopeptidase [Amycolatopsis sp. TRM77291]